jgi:hypothetical protein
MRLSTRAAILTVSALVIGTLGAQARMMNHETGYTQTNIVSDLSSEKATLTDSDLLNSWGIAFFQAVHSGSMTTMWVCRLSTPVPG